MLLVKCINNLRTERVERAIDKMRFLVIRTKHSIWEWHAKSVFQQTFLVWRSYDNGKLWHAGVEYRSHMVQVTSKRL